VVLELETHNPALRWEASRFEMLEDPPHQEVRV